MTKNGGSPNHSPKRGVFSPWNQVVAAGAPPPPSSSPSPAVDSSTVNPAPPEEPDNGVGHNVNSVKRSAWNKPSNGASSTVMGADSWPALSKSAKAPSKSHSPSLSQSSKGLIDSPPLQVTGTVLPSPQRQFRDNASATTHQKPFKRGNSNPSSNGGHSSHPSGPQGSNASTGSHNHNSSSKEHQPRTGFVSNDNQQQRNPFRHRNGGLHQRGDGAHHHSYGGRRDQDRGNHDWNNNRNFNGRENYMSPRFPPRFIRPPPPPPNPAHMFVPPPPPMRLFGASYGYPELPPPMFYAPPPPLDSLRGVPFGPPLSPNAMFFQPLDPLHIKIVNQVNYYFSEDNLVKDEYLRQNMDEQGWVPINLIAGFNKIMHLTDNIQIVLDAVRTSSVVEVQDDKIRVRNDWRRWVYPLVQYSDVTLSQTDGQLAEQVQSISLETTNDDGAQQPDASQINNDGAQQPDASQNRPFGDF